MHPQQFQTIVENRLSACHNVLSAKGSEYSRHNDRLHNFKSAAAMDGTTPFRSLWGMWKKHLVSIKDMIDDLDAGIVPGDEVVAEKLGDNINYTLLLEAMIKERQQEYFAVSVEELASLEQAIETEATDMEDAHLQASNLRAHGVLPENCCGSICRRQN